ncbi:33108_t:CDS:2, partial [Racocetra persica]
QDRRNLEFIVEKAVNDKYLNSMIFAINGRQNVFYMDNLSFSCNPNEWRSDSLEVEQSWDVSRKTTDNFLTAIENCGFKSTEDFQDLTAQIRNAIGEISKINGAIIQLLGARYECEKNENILESSKDYTREEFLDSIQHDIESLKIISKLNFDRSLRSTFDKLKTTSESVSDENLKAKQLKKISEIEE